MIEMQKLSSFLNTRVLVAILAGLVVSGLSVWGYTWYRERQERVAHMVFADCMHEYELAYAKQEPWSKVENLCKAAYDNNSSSHLAPYILAMQADALISQNKLEDARLVFKTLMSKLSSSSPLYGVYAIKYALLCMDASDTQIQESGLKSLEHIAYSVHIPSRDQALYYLGLYYQMNNKQEQAQKTWSDLVRMLKDGTMVGSAWAALAESKLAQAA